MTANHDLPAPDFCTCQSGSCGPQPPDKSFVPMVWNIQLMLNDPVDDKYPILLGFNEPNHADQSDIEPDVAAAAWIELQDMYPDKVLPQPLGLFLIDLMTSDPRQPRPSRRKCPLV